MNVSPALMINVEYRSKVIPHYRISMARTNVKIRTDASNMDQDKK